MNENRDPREGQLLQDELEQHLVDQGHEGERDEKRQSMVEIVVDGKTVMIHRGSQAVSTIKSIAGIAAAYCLTQVIGGRYVPLSDDGKVTIKGGEIFESHAPEGQSS